MKTNIQQRSLTDCLDNVIDYRGKTPKKLGLEWCNVGYRAISANNVKFDGLTKIDSINCLDEAGYKKWMKEEVKKGDLLLTSEAPAGQVMLWMNDEKIVLSQRLFALRTKPDVYNKYLKYYLQSNVGQFEINKNTSGSTVFGISAKMFDFIKVNLPDYDSQISIGDLLYLIDSKIELNNRINAELEAMAKTLYDYWFVQFDFPDKNGKPYKTSGGKMVWNDELKREIPEGWEVKRIGDFGEFKNGINYDPSLEGNTDAKIINVRNISSSNLFVSQFDLDTIRLQKSNVDKYLVTDKDILIARSGIPGATRMMLEFAENTIYCGFIIRFQVNSIIEKNYLFYFLKDMEKNTTSKSGGTIMPNVNQDTMKRMLVIEPNEKVVIKFNEFINPVFRKMNEIIQENEKLSELRDWLLPMLMNGQVKVN